MKKRIVEGRWGAGWGGVERAKGNAKKRLCVRMRERMCVCDCKRGKKECALSSAQGKSSAQEKGKPSTALLLQLVEVACGSVPL